MPIIRLPSLARRLRLSSLVNRRGKQILRCELTRALILCGYGRSQSTCLVQLSFHCIRQEILGIYICRWTSIELPLLLSVAMMSPWLFKTHYPCLSAAKERVNATVPTSAATYLDHCIWD